MSKSHKQTIRPGKELRNVRVSYCGAEPVGEQDLEQLRRDAYDQGQKDFHDAYQQEIFEAREDMRRLRDEVLVEIGKRVNGLCEEFEAQAPLLVMAVVRKIWAGLEIGEEHVRAILEETLAELAPQREGVEVSLCHRDYELLAQGKEFTGEYPGIRFKTDKTLKPGDVLVHSRFGVLDGRIEKKIERMEQQLQEGRQ